MSWATWLMALVGPIARRVLVSLGISLVTYAGISTAINTLLSNAKSAFGGFGGPAGQLFAMAGGNVFLSIIAGAIIGRVSMIALKRFMPV